ncbi:MAG: peptide ABC transporter permease [Candidatus Marinimicrobia bacterium]|nr:peptide ABC transporter permease [Candidatus Neomarinimicrobiota bacterium]|tara:strand:- start:76 stop:1251 length:1176 start_codon:yes stop_codon:yes gene_type:complete
MTNKNLSESILQKRINRFKSIKRGYYSLIILISLYVLSICAPIIFNSKAIMVKYNDEYYFPLFNSIFSNKNIEAKDLGQFEIKGKKKYGQPHYRLLKKQYQKEDKGNWVIMPLYPYDPYEEVISEKDEQFTDVNGNGVWDPSENFIDENGNGIADKYKYTNFPNSQHLLGTDNQGRDVLSRLIYGFNISITFAIVCCFLSYIIGIIIGGTLGYFGGKVDLFGLRIIEIYGSIPFLFMLMILATFIKPNVYILASMYVFLTGWIGITWYVRGEFLREKSKDYVSAAVSMGQSHWNVMFRHILPNSLTPVITFAPFAIIGYISALVSLDYLGFGLQPPTPSWGELMAQGRTNLQYWHLIVSPLFSIGATLFLITFIGEAIREAFDPKVHSRLR